MATLEARGVPTVSIVDKDFVNDFKSTSHNIGIPEAQAAVASAPYTGMSHEQVRADVERIIDQIIEGITKPIRAGTGPILEAITTQAGYQAPWGVIEKGPVDDETITFAGKDFEEAYQKFQDCFMKWGWSDGLPLVFPTRTRVEAMLKGTTHKPDEVVAEKFPPSEGRATVRCIAINAVMAGCDPLQLPVVLAATEAMYRDPQFIITAQSTSPHACYFIVNGPVIKDLKFNYLGGTLGPGAQSKVNIAVGRATRLVMMNIGGVYVGIKDMDVIGSALKFTCVLAENEEDAARLGWQPYHVDKGFKATESTITQMRIMDQNEIFGMATENPEGLLAAAASDIGCIACGMGAFALSSQVEGPDKGLGVPRILIVLSGDDARIIQRGGWKTKESIAKYIADHVVLNRDAFSKYHSLEHEQAELAMLYPSGGVCGLVKPENVMIVRGGYSPGKSAFHRSGAAHTVSIDKWK